MSLISPPQKKKNPRYATAHVTLFRRNKLPITPSLTYTADSSSVLQGKQISRLGLLLVRVQSALLTRTWLMLGKLRAHLVI